MDQLKIDLIIVFFLFKYLFIYSSNKWSKPSTDPPPQKKKTLLPQPPWIRHVKLRTINIFYVEDALCFRRRQG